MRGAVLMVLTQMILGSGFPRGPYLYYTRFFTVSMEIDTVDAVPIGRDLDERFANAQKWIDSREYCLVRVRTTEGISGWGECWGPVAGTREILEEYVEPWLRGREVRNVEQIHDDLIFKLRSSYHSFVPANVVSGIDIALWDAYGKSTGASVASLIGGRRRDKVQAYATGHFFRDVDEFEDLRDLILEEAREHVDAGFTALKQKIGLHRHFPYDFEYDIELVRSVREEFGSDIRLMADANHAYDMANARRVADALAELDVYFFEEPFTPDIDNYATLAMQTDVPLASGECWAFQREFERAISKNAIDYVQPDVTSAGGITSTRRVVTTADAANIQCLPHVFGTPIALAASLQVIATIPGSPMLEFDRTPNPIRESLVRDPIRNDGPVVAIPSDSGLGIRIDETALESFQHT